MFGQGFNSGFFAGPNYIYKEDIFGDNSCIELYTMDYDFSDSSGNDNDMGVYGSPDNGVYGEVKLGARFDGYNTSARAYPVSNLQGLTAVSISFWFKWDDSASVSNYGHMVNIGDMGGIGNGDAFGIAVGDDGGTYNKVLYGWFPEGSLSTGQTVTDNVWHHVLMTYSGTTVKYYYDGNSTPIATQTRTSLSLPNSAVNRITVGHYAYNGDHHFKGDLDHLRVFNREIQSSELATLYNEAAKTLEATTTNINYPIANTAYYKLDNNSKDSARSTGKFNEGAIFNGSSSYISIPQGNLPVGASARTVSLWIKTTQTASAELFGYGVDGTNLYYALTLNASSGKVGTAFYANDHNFTASVIDGNWHHIVSVYNGNILEMYVDGNSVGSSTIGAVNTGSGGTPKIGKYNYTGDIDQVRIYNTALDSTDVSNLYAETVGDTSTLSFPSGETAIATYQLDGNSTDLSGNYNGTDTNITYAYDGAETNIEYRFGRFGQAAVFNGSSSKIVTTLNPNGFSQIAISCWINTSLSTGTGSGHIVSANDGTNWCFLSILKSTGIVTFSASNGGSNIFSATHTGAINDGSWHHVVGSYNGTNATLYIDSTGHTPVSATASLSVNTAFGVGYRNTASPSGTYYAGSIDQVRIYSTALGADQVTKLYNEKPEVDTSNFKTVLYDGTGATDYISSVGFDPNLIWFKERNGTNSHQIYDGVRGYDYALFSNLTDAQYNYSTHPNGDLAPASVEANGFFTPTVNNNGINRNGGDYVAWVWKGGGLLNRSAYFNGSGYIDTGYTAGSGTAASISFWANIEAYTTYGGFVGDSTGSGAAARFFLGQGGGTSGNLWVSIGNGSSSWNDETTVSLTSYGLNKWFHLVGTVDGTTVKIYINGSLVHTYTSSVSYSGAGTFPYYLGGWGNSLRLQGKLDQVRLFNKAISLSEVGTLYNETASTINTLQVLGDTSCVAAYPLGVGAGDIGNTYSGTPTNVTFNNPGHLTRNNSGTIESTVSANTDAGFSIVKYTGNNTDGATVGTGLTEACNIVIVKDLTSANYWCVGGSTIGNGENLYLNDTGQKLTRDRVKSVQTSTFTLGSHFEVNSSNNFIAYCWHSVAGYSKIGSYDGHTTNPTFIDTGFEPSFVMIKATNFTQSWAMFDNKRGNTSGSGAPEILFADNTSVYTINNSALYMTFSDNGFQPATAFSGINGTGRSFIYMAFK